jgi:hypothetical protein
VKLRSLPVLFCTPHSPDRNSSLGRIRETARVSNGARGDGAVHADYRSSGIAARTCIRAARQSSQHNRKEAR